VANSTLLSTTLDPTAEQIVTWFVRRWTMEVTFEKARAHLGMETQRQWHDRAIARTTAALLSLYSIITLTAHLLIEKGTSGVRSTAWYAKSDPTFSDAMALYGGICGITSIFPHRNRRPT
jgi:hypothetical protein